jgi:hypothetical protein
VSGAAGDAVTLEVGGVRWWPRPGLSVDAARPTLERAWAAVEAGAEERKRGRRKGLHALDLAGSGAPDHLLKVNRYRGARRRRSKSRRELAVAAALAQRGLPAPVPLAAGERREGGRLVACYLLVEILPRVSDLRVALAARPASPARRRALAAAWGELARRLHEAGLHQDDFQPNNFLVRWPEGDAAAPASSTGEAAVPELFVIDFERARLRRGPVPDRLRHRALAKLDREMGRAPASLRLRFLRAYEGDPVAARARWRAVAAEAPALARRDAGHLLRNATVPGRRFEAVRLPDHRGIALPGLEHDRLERAAVRAERAASAVSGAPDASEWGVRLARPGLRHGRRVLARALVLAARGLAPRPLALLCGRESTILLLERGERALAAHEVRRNAALESGWRVLERRLRAYGRLTRPLSELDLAVEPVGSGGVRATLLGVEAFDVRSRLDTLRGR